MAIQNLRFWEGNAMEEKGGKGRGGQGDRKRRKEDGRNEARRGL